MTFYFQFNIEKVSFQTMSKKCQYNVTGGRIRSVCRGHDTAARPLSNIVSD